MVHRHRPAPFLEIQPKNGQGDVSSKNNKHKPLTGKNSGLKDSSHYDCCNGGDVVPGRKQCFGRTGHCPS